MKHRAPRWSAKFGEAKLPTILERERLVDSVSRRLHRIDRLPKSGTFLDASLADDSRQSQCGDRLSHLACGASATDVAVRAIVASPAEIFTPSPVQEYCLIAGSCCGAQSFESARIATSTTHQKEELAGIVTSITRWQRTNAFHIQSPRLQTTVQSDSHGLCHCHTQLAPR